MKNLERIWEREMDSYSRINQAAEKILRMVAEDELTLAEFDAVITTVKHRAVMRDGYQG